MHDRFEINPNQSSTFVLVSDADIVLKTSVSVIGFEPTAPIYN